MLEKAELTLITMLSKTKKVMGTVYGFANEVKMISGTIFSVECLESYFADDASQKITAGSGEESE